QLGGVATADQILVQRCDVNQSRRIADRVVLVLVMHFVHAGRVVSRPLAIVEALAERKGAFVKGSSDRHNFTIPIRYFRIPIRYFRTRDYTYTRGVIPNSFAVDGRERDLTRRANRPGSEPERVRRSSRL